MERAEVLDRLAGRYRTGALDAVLIAGPTASGKSALALELAEMVGGAVVNADSMQVYDALRILSARPTLQEEARADHRLYGFVPATLEYSVGDYLRDVAPVLHDLKAAGRLAVITGGTGLYFRALTEGLVETPVIPADVRARWQAAALRGDDLHAALAARDAQAAARLNRADMPRLQRALELHEVTGEPIAQLWQTRQGTAVLTPGCWEGVFLSPGREALCDRIDARFQHMIEAGALDEVRAIAARELPRNRGIMKAHGVPHLLDFLSGALPLAEAIARGQGDTRRYAKRQVTWARKFMAGWAWIGA